MRNILLAILVFATSALAADFTGNWSGEGVTNGESHSLYFVLKQDGDTLTGSGGPDAAEQHPFKSAKLDGDKITLEIAVGNKGTLHFELQGDPVGLKGTVKLVRDDGNESGPVTLKKVASQAGHEGLKPAFFVANPRRVIG
jgi:hypothetical protein